MSYFDGL